MSFLKKLSGDTSVTELIQHEVLKKLRDLDSALGDKTFRLKRFFLFSKKVEAFSRFAVFLSADTAHSLTQAFSFKAGSKIGF